MSILTDAIDANRKKTAASASGADAGTKKRAGSVLTQAIDRARGGETVQPMSGGSPLPRLGAKPMAPARTEKTPGAATSWPSVEQAQTDLESWSGQLDGLHGKLEAARRDTEAKAAELEGIYSRMQAYQADRRFGSDVIITSAYDNLAKQYNELLPSYLEAASAHDSMAEEYNALLAKYQSGYDRYTTMLSGQGDRADELLKEAEELEEQNKTLARSIQQQSSGIARAGMYGNVDAMQKKLAEDQARYAETKGQIEALKAQAEQARAYYYGSIPMMKDYETLSAAGTAKRQADDLNLWKFWQEKGDDLYDFINDLRLDGEESGYRDQVALLSMGTGQSGKYGEYTPYSYMTKDEIGVYNYIYATKGREAAEAYLDELMNSLNYRQGKEGYESLSGVGKALHWIPAGLDQFASGIEQLFSEKAVPTSPVQYTNQMIAREAEETHPLLGIAYNLGTTVSNMAPSLLLGAVTGGLLSGAGVAAGTASAISGGVAAGSVGLSAGGNAYTQKVNEGYTPEQARSYASLVGVSEAALQYLLGGIAGAGGVGAEQVLAKAAPKIAAIDNALLRTVVDGGLRLTVRGTAEGIEEGLQAFLEPAFATLILDETYDWGENFESAAYSFLMGFLASGVVEGVSMAAGAGKAQNTFNADMEGYLGDAGTDHFAGCKTAEEVERRYRELAREHHPDLGGDTSTMAEINRQHNMRKAWHMGREQAQRTETPQEDRAADTSEEIQPLSLPSLTEETSPSPEGAPAERAPGIRQAQAPADIRAEVGTETPAAESLLRPEAAGAPAAQSPSLPDLKPEGGELDSRGAAGAELMNGGMDYEPGDGLSDGDQGWVPGAGAGEQAGGVAAGAARAVPPAEQGGAAISRQNRGKHLRAERVSSLDLGLQNGTETPAVSVVTEDAWDEGLRATAERVYQETGLPVTYVLGSIPIQDGTGAVRKVRGVYGTDRIILQADNLRVTTDQIADHEIYHDKAFQTPGLNRDVELQIIERFGREEFERVLTAYVERMRGIVDLQENATPEEIDEALLAVKEEVFADAYAGINAFSAHAERFQDTVRETAAERGAGKQNAAATERTTGPPRERYSYGGRNANRADSESLARAEEMERAGEDPEAIRQETGWHRGADGLWRFEIDDSGMEYRRTGDAARMSDPEYREYLALWDKGVAKAEATEEELERLRELDARYGKVGMLSSINIANGNATLGDVLIHDELFRNYPQLRRTGIRFADLDPGVRGEYRPGRNEIALNNSLRGAPEDTLIHEIQHAIQRAEGFATGSSTEYWRERLENGYDNRTHAELAHAESLQRQYDVMEAQDPEFMREMEALYADVPDMPRGQVNWDTLEQIEEDPVEWKEFDARRDALEEKYGEKIFDFFALKDDLIRARIGKREASDLYYNTAGEIEARDAAKRRAMTAEQRRAAAPDIGDEDVVFTGGGEFGYAMSADEQAGIKEQLRMHQEELNNMEPATVINRDDMSGLTASQARVRLSGELKKTGYKVDRPGFGVIQFEEKEINNSLNYKEETAAAEDARRTAMLALPQVLKRGKEISGHRDHKGRGYGTVTIAAPVVINGKRGNMAVVVRETKGNRYKVHRILTPDGGAFTLEKTDSAERYSVGGITDAVQTPGGTVPANTFRATDSISQNSRESNRENQTSEGLSLPTLAEEDSQGRELTADQEEYFRDSKARDDRGRLLTLYHQTEGTFTVFDPHHEGAGTEDSETPSGVFLKPTSEDIGLRGKRQMELYANITAPLTVRNRAELAFWYREHVHGYRAAEERIREIEETFGAEYEAAEERSDAWYEENYEAFTAGKISEEEAEAHVTGELDEILGRWKLAEAEARRAAKTLLDDYFSGSDYDGLHLLEDAGSFGRNVETWIAFQPEQVKRTANKRPTRDPDIRFSLDEDPELAVSAEENEAAVKGQYAPVAQARYSLEEEAEREQKPKRKKTKPMAESLPIIAKRDLKTNLLNLFSIPEGQRAELGTIVEQYADRLLKNGELTQADRDTFFDRMYAEGVMTVPAEEYYAMGRDAVKGGRVYVSVQDQHEFGDDWNAFRKQAFANGIFLTNDPADQGIDQWNMELAEMLPGLFDGNELDSRTVLERIVQVAEEGKDQKLSLAEYAAELAGREYVSEDEILDNMERQMDWALRTFAEKARLEIHLRDRTGAKIAQEREKFSQSAQRQRERDLVRRAKERDARKAMQQSRRENRELRELQKKTLKQLQWLSKNRYKAPEQLKEAWDEVLGDIDIYAVGAANELNWSKKHQATWRDLAQLYKTAQETDPNFLPSKELEKIVARLDGDKIADMDVDALQDLYRAAVGLRTEFYNRNNVINDEMNRLFEEVYADSKREIDTAPGGYRGEKLDKFMNLEQLTPMNVLERMGGWNPDGAFYSMAKQLERGERDVRAYTVKANRQLEEFLTEHEDWVKKADGQGKDAIWYELEVPELMELGMGDKPIFGDTVTVYMTPSQKIHMYLESKSADNLRHMTGGRTFADRELYSQGKRQEAFAQGRTIRMAPETVKKLVSDLTEEEMELARILERYYNDFAKKEINRVANILYGYDKAQSKNYAPIYTNKNYTKSEIGIFDTTAEGVGNLKSRQYSKNPSYNISAFDAFERHVEQTARFVGMSIPARNWQTLLNWREKNNSMADVITHKWGEESKRYIEDLLNRLQGGSAVESDTVGEFADKVLSNYISAIFGANPSIVLKQLGSIPLASAYLGAASFPTPAQISHIDRDLIAKYTSDLAWRTMGYTTPETKHLKENPNWTQTNKATRFAFGGGAITAMDGWAASVLWPWAENKVRREMPDLEVGTREQIDAGESPFYRKVAEEFNNAVSRSQSVSDETHQGKLRKSRNPVTRAFTMFKSDSAQGYNTLRQKLGEAKHYERTGDAEKARKAKRAAGGAFVALIGGYLWASVVSFLIAMWKNKGKHYRDDEGELTFGSVAGEMAMDLVGSLTGIVAGGEELMEFIGNVLTGDTWYGIDTPGLEQVTDILELLQEKAAGGLEVVRGAADVIKNGGDLGDYLKRHGNDILGSIKELAIAAGTYIPGIPVQNLEAYIMGTVKWISPELGTAYEDLMATADKDGLKGLKGDALEQRIGDVLRGRIGDVPDGAAAALAALYEAGYTAAVPGDTPRQVTVNGEKRELSAYQQQVFETVWRDSVAEALTAVLEEPWYASLDSAAKEKVLDKLYDYGAQSAKAALFEEFEPDSFVEKIGAFRAAGMDAVDCLEAWRKFTEIEDGGAAASERATAFAYWADSQGYTDRQKQVVKDSFTVFSHIPVEPKRYQDLQEAGLTDSEARDLTGDLAGLEPEEGADAVTDLQRLRTIADAGLDRESMTMAMGTVLGTEMTTESGGKSQYALMLEALDAGYTVDEWLDLKEAGYMTESAFEKVRISGDYDISPAQYIRYRDLLISADAMNEDPEKRNNSIDQNETAAALNGMLGLTNAQKAALWQLQNKSWKAGKNPFDTGVGQAVYNAMHSEETLRLTAGDAPQGLSLPSLRG